MWVLLCECQKNYWSKFVWPLETDGYIVSIFHHLINYSKIHRYAELDGYIFLLYRAMNFHGQATYGQILFILRRTFISTFSCVFALFNNLPKLETLLIGHPVYSSLHTRSVAQHLIVSSVVHNSCSARRALPSVNR